MTLIYKNFKVYVDVVTFSFSEVLVSAQENKENTCDLLPTFFNSFNLNFSSVFFSGLLNFQLEEWVYSLQSPSEKPGD